MALSGSLREFALSEILQLLSSQRKTGCLRLTRGADMRVVYLLEGRIASMRDRGYGEDDPLGRFLRRVHRLSEEQLRGIASIHAESNRPIASTRASSGTSIAVCSVMRNGAAPKAISADSGLGRMA